MDQSGNLYGTNASEGANGEGTVFELVPVAGKKWKRRTLHAFCSESGCADGAKPFGSLIVDTAGNLYGTTYSGGGHGYGDVFELVPDAARKKWKLHVLHRFCAQNSCPDGGFPYAGLAYVGQAGGIPYDGASPLYGTAEEGGSNYFGVVFQIRPNHGRWKEKVIYGFCAQDFCADGNAPLAAVIADDSSNLYGTTYLGGDNDAGVVFKLSPDGHGGWTQTVLHAFCSSTDCADGSTPYASLLRDAAGNLYGTTTTGGLACSNNDPQCGVVFKLAPDGTETVLHDFCSQANCSDGAIPYGGLVMDAAGNLYGTTIYGGNSQNKGTLFRLGSSYKVLHTFCSNANLCDDGAWPESNLLLGPSGEIFGVTEGGGIGGVAFAFVPKAP